MGTMSFGGFNYIHSSMQASIVNLSFSLICEISACYIKVLNLAILSIYRSAATKIIDNFLNSVSNALNLITKIDNKINILMAFPMRRIDKYIGFIEAITIIWFLPLKEPVA